MQRAAVRRLRCNAATHVRCRHSFRAPPTHAGCRLSSAVPESAPDSQHSHLTGFTGSAPASRRARSTCVWACCRSGQNLDPAHAAAWARADQDHPRARTLFHPRGAKVVPCRPDLAAPTSGAPHPRQCPGRSVTCTGHASGRSGAIVFSARIKSFIPQQRARDVCPNSSARPLARCRAALPPAGSAARAGGHSRPAPRSAQPGWLCAPRQGSRCAAARGALPLALHRNHCRQHGRPLFTPLPQSSHPDRPIAAVR